MSLNYLFIFFFIISSFTINAQNELKKDTIYLFTSKLENVAFLKDGRIRILWDNQTLVVIKDSSNYKKLIDYRIFMSRVLYKKNEDEYILYNSGDFIKPIIVI